MTLSKHLIVTTLTGFLFFVSSCEKATETTSTPEPVKPEPVAKAPAPQPIEVTKADEPFTEDKLMELLGDGNLSDENIQLLGENLSDEQRKTLESAIRKATKDIDLSLLQSSLASGLAGGNWDMKGADVKVLTPEEAKQMGANLPEGIGSLLEGIGSSDGAVTSTKVITLSGDDANPENVKAMIEKLKAQAGVENSENGEVITEVIESEPIVIDAAESVDGAKIQQLLESGDSEGLAKELSNLIQTGIDTAALNQLGVGSTSEEKPAKPTK